MSPGVEDKQPRCASGAGLSAGHPGTCWQGRAPDPHVAVTATPAEPEPADAPPGFDASPGRWPDGSADTVSTTTTTS